MCVAVHEPSGLAYMPSNIGNAITLLTARAMKAEHSGSCDFTAMVQFSPPFQFRT
jgi:hypothetical protein